VNTYLSRDAGWNWSEIRKGIWTYEIGDHGSLLIAADRSKLTSNLIFSRNEGFSWEDCTFTTQGDVDITNIVVEPSWKSKRFILYGLRSTPAEGDVGILVSIDFMDLHPAACRNPDKAGSPDSDYENWSPQDAASEKGDRMCILGKHTVYTRRKQMASCYNPQEYEPISSSATCACTFEDYECDFCFDRLGNGSCVPTCFGNDPYAVPANCEGSYQVTTGYRLDAATTCDPTAAGAVDLRPTSRPCPASSDGSGMSVHVVVTAVVVALLIAIIIAVLVFSLLAYRTKKPKWAYDRIQTFLTFRGGDDGYSKLSILSEDGKPDDHQHPDDEDSS